MPLSEMASGVAFRLCDLRDIDALRTGWDRLKSRLGPASVLVNNAARDDRHDWRDVTPEYWDERMAVNLRHQFFAAQAVYPHMQALGGGSIINIASLFGLLGVPTLSSYNASKAAVIHLTRSLAVELAEHRIRVNCIAPAHIPTAINAAMAAVACAGFTPIGRS